jgi:hypothetical protein
VIILAALPYLVVRVRQLAAVLAKDLDEHRWTAEAIDAHFGSTLIASRIILISALAYLFVELVAYVRAVTTRRILIFLVVSGLSVLPGCRCTGGRSGAGASAGPWLPMAKTGPESWTVDGTEYRVTATYYLVLPDGLQYTIDYEAPPGLDLEHMDDARAFAAVAPLVQHAASANLYSRQVIRDLTSGAAVPVKKIGVSIYRQSGIRTRAFRVARSLDQLKDPRPETQ